MFTLSMLCSLCVLYFIHHVLCLSLFPTHMDLQKVGDTIFNNEKFNIYKPTIHQIRDHFEDYILRRENITPNANERIFVDKNGFRHFWSGFEDRSSSLRKTDLLDMLIKKNATAKNPLIFKTNTTSSTTATPLNITEETTKYVPKRRTTTTEAPEPLGEVSALRQGANGKCDTVAKVTFYCPYFGVVRMFNCI